MHGETPQYNGWNGIGNVAPYIPRNQRVHDCTCRERVIANDRAPFADNEATRSSLDLVAARTVLEPVRQHRLAAPEGIDLVGIIERRWSAQDHLDVGSQGT